jgi:MoxR-like ATPase
LNPQVLSEQEAVRAAELCGKVRTCLNGVLFGQEVLVELVVAAVLARGHLLLEGLPGVGKTQLVKGLSSCVGLEAKRIQFTPDLLPGDITGSMIFDSKDSSFAFHKGPIFAHIVLADEINRASPKTQSALLEAMQEQCVTIMGDSKPLPEPFFVLATQNPIELEGTYPLPEAQLDRFLFKLEITSAPLSVLERIVRERHVGSNASVTQVLSPDDLAWLMESTRRIFLPDVVANYIARMVDATHPGRFSGIEGIKYGASPRAAIGLAAAARAFALSKGRINVSFEDVQHVAGAVLNHRIVMDYSARVKGITPRAVVETLIRDLPRHTFETPPTIKTTPETRS